MVSLPSALWSALAEPLILCVISFPLLPQNQLEAHQDEGMVISHMAVAGVGIWIAFTSGSTLRLFHTETLKHLQDVNIDAPVHSMLPGTLRGREGSGVTLPCTACSQVPQKKGKRAAELKEQRGQPLLVHIQPVQSMDPGYSHMFHTCRCTAFVCAT